MGKLLYKVYQQIAKARWWALFTILVIVALLFNIARTIAFDDDISSLIPANAESQRIQKVLKSISFTDKIVVNIQKGEQGSVDDLTRYANEFLDSVKASQGEFIKNIQGKVYDEELPKILNLAYDNLPLFLDDQDYLAIAQKLSKDSIVKLTADNYKTLISPTGIVAKKNIVKDPLGLSFIALKKLRQLGFGDGFKLKNGFVLNDAEENILLFITPTFSSGETNKNLPFSEALYRIQEALNSKYGTKVQGEYFGAALSAVSNAMQIKRDIQFTVSIAMTLLIVLLILFYRKWTLPIILFAPTLFGGLLAIAVLCLLRDTISAISLGIGSILLGVTLDYGLHILTHIRNGESIKSLYKEVAPSVLLSSITTASAFLCLLFLESQALKDLGIFAAISVLGASFFALLFIPQVYKGKNVAADKTTILDRWVQFDWHKSKIALGALALLFIISIFTYQKVVFDHDIAKLNYETQNLLDARNRLEKLTDFGSKSLYLATYGKNLEEVLQHNDRLHGQLNQLKQDGKILSFGSIGTLAKSERTQSQKTKAWKQFWNTNRTDSLKQNLIESGNELGFKATTFAPFYSFLQSDFKPLNLADLRGVESFSLDDYIVTDTTGTTITSLIKIDSVKTDEIKQQFETETNTLLIDRQNVNETLLGSLKNDFNRLLGYSLIAVLLILLLFYRSLTLTLITGTPIFLSWFLTVGIMGLFHIEFNIFNIIICSFIFGLGVDYSIFMTNGMLTEYRTGEKTLATHKTSIVLSVLTTIAGIGVMIFAKHPVLYTVSVVSLIGIGCALFVAFTLQPLLFKLFVGDTNKRPITVRYLAHSLLSFAYFDLGGLVLSIYSWFVMKLNPKARLTSQPGLHKVTSKFMKSVLYTNPFLRKTVRNPHQETFEKPAMLIANHASFLDILAMGMLHPKSIYLVKDHVYNSNTVGYAARLHGAYPVSGGIENGEDFLRQKLIQGFSIIAFPEGSRSETNKIQRFHKGAFYLAEQLGLDILPIMIHGSSEVSPKNSFIIRDGSISVDILPRITPEDPRFDKSYSKRAKQIGQYFRSEFRSLRNEIETDTYWHKLLLENYRFKGDKVYREVKKDLIAHSKTYKTILKLVENKESIIHLSNDYGQLDLLMALDNIDRKIYSFLEDSEARVLLKNNYLTHKYSKITLFETSAEALQHKAEVLLVHGKASDIITKENKKLKEFDILILLQPGHAPDNSVAQELGFKMTLKNDDLMVMTKNDID
ncbi:MAG: MMPL family transporter [Flavobacteriaceae bacterium]